MLKKYYYFESITFFLLKKSFTQNIKFLILIKGVLIFYLWNFPLNIILNQIVK